MLCHLRKIEGYKLGATDGELGRVADFYFDDQSWTVRYLVADTGAWLPRERVLLSPFALRQVNRSEKTIAVSLTKKQIAESPPIHTHEPASRKFEREYHQYYGWPMYWYGPALWGPTPFPLVYSESGEPVKPPSASEEKPEDAHLRSTNEVIGYHLRGSDKEIGHVEDFIVTDENWAIRYLVIDTRNWWPGRRVLLVPQWIHEVSWEKSAVVVDLPRDVIKGAPEYDPAVPLTRDYETRLHEHYQRQPYWATEPPVVAR